MNASKSQLAPDGGSVLRRVRIAWTQAEDDDILRVYNQSNVGFPTYVAQARKLNRLHHEGKEVRSARSVRRRECALLTGKANVKVRDRSGGGTPPQNQTS